jgi:hypothetical protein
VTKHLSLLPEAEVVVVVTKLLLHLSLLPEVKVVVVLAASFCPYVFGV